MAQIYTVILALLIAFLPAGWTVLFYSVEKNTLCFGVAGTRTFSCREIGKDLRENLTPEQAAATLGIQ